MGRHKNIAVCCSEIFFMAYLPREEFTSRSCLVSRINTTYFWSNRLFYLYGLTYTAPTLSLSLSLFSTSSVLLRAGNILDAREHHVDQAPHTELDAFITSPNATLGQHTSREPYEGRLESHLLVFFVFLLTSRNSFTFFVRLFSLLTIPATYFFIKS